MNQALDPALVEDERFDHDLFAINGRCSFSDWGLYSMQHLWDDDLPWMRTDGEGDKGICGLLCRFPCSKLGWIWLNILEMAIGRGLVPSNVDSTNRML